jgi:DNA polymerase-3 subunit chi
VRADFYHLDQTTVEGTLPALAAKVLAAGQRLLVVSADAEQLARIDRALWEVKDAFLAHGQAGGAHDARQPILLSAEPSPANGATFIAFADGAWREAADGYQRAFLLFDDATIAGARATWRLLGDRAEVERRFWKQQGGKWVEGP